MMSTKATERAMRMGLILKIRTPVGMMDSFPRGGKKYPVMSGQRVFHVCSSRMNARM